MALAKCNYVVVYDNSPQVYTTSSLETVLDAAPPKNSDDAKRTILFLSYFPDTQELKVFEVTEAELAQKRIEVAETMARREEKRQAKAGKELQEDAKSQASSV